MKDLEKVQKTLSDVFDYLNRNNDKEVGKQLLTEVGDAHRIVENLVIRGVSKWVACKERLPKGIGTNLIKYPIIIFDTEEGVVGAFYYENEENRFQTDEGLEYYNVTHWRELPEPPFC